MGRLTSLTMIAGAAVLAGCASGSGGVFTGGDRVNFAEGAQTSARMTSGDIAALRDAVVASVEAGATGSPTAWSGPGARGSVTPGSYSLANLKYDPAVRIDARQGLDLTHAMETDLGLYVLTRNSNVRTGPSTERRIAEVLPSGTGVDVVGKITGQPWMLVAVDERVRGYVHENLVIKAPGTELELAGGPERRPRLCRDVSLRLVAAGVSENLDTAVCAYGDEWRPAPPQPEEAPAREDDDDLLGY